MKMRYLKPTSFKEEMSADRKEKHYPSIYLKTKDIPEAKDWKIGEKYTVEMEVRLHAMSDSIEGQDSLTLDITGVSVK